MAGINIALEVFGIIISTLLLLCCIIEVPASKKQNYLFIAMLSINILVLACDAVTWIVENNPDYSALMYVCNFFVFSLGYVLTAIFSWYLILFVSAKKQISGSIIRIINALCCIAILLVVVSMFNHMYFRFDNGVYKRGDLYIISQLYPIGIMLIDMIIVVRNSKILGVHDTVSFLLYGIIPVIAMTIQIAVYGITLLYMATTLSLIVIYVMIHVEENRRIERQKSELARANTAIMLSQIQPHFLYNSLATIAYLCDSEPKKAKEATLEFSRYLRGNIDSLKQNEPVSFETELQHIKTYLSLEKMRFQNDLNTVYDIKTNSFSVPPLTVQPLVENAVKYGVGVKEGGGTVKLSTWEEPDAYMVSVSDNGVGFNPNKTPCDGRSHIGIENVRNRLKAMCHATLTIESAKDYGTTVTISIPKENYNENNSGR